MKTLTVRGIDPELTEKLNEEARKRQTSVNQVIIESLRARFNLDKEKRFTVVHHDLDHLFGQWTAEEYERIQRGIDAERKIDPELWQ
jgi:predicted transcriptional regulator